MTELDVVRNFCDLADIERVVEIRAALEPSSIAQEQKQPGTCSDDYELEYLNAADAEWDVGDNL